MSDRDKHTTINDKPLLRIGAVSKRFGSHLAVDDLSLDIREGEFFALLGPSGCGKTTLLRMLAGFETPDSGVISLDGRDIAAVPPHQRPVNMMFQSYALFPHLDVAGNIAFGLKRAGFSRTEISSSVAELVAMTRLEGLEQRRPDQLSGGQRQRVALARSLARKPRLLLLDEPLAALDRNLREVTQAELLALQRKLKMTFVIVTHDQDEAMRVADRIAVMNKGRLVQVSAPRELYESPKSRWAASFFGDINIFDGQVVSRADGRVSIRTQAAGVLTVPSDRQPADGAALAVGIRPEKISMSAAAASPEAANTLRGEIVDTTYLGEMTAYRVKLASGEAARVRAPNHLRADAPPFGIGDSVSLSFPPDACILLES
ncbi:MAG: ABC transporter ATP-binding protein [Xanthobacteraceae bacterium]